MLQGIVSMRIVFALNLLISYYISIISCGSLQKLFQFRGGLVPEASDSSPDEYYDRFELDYGTNDNKRIAGALKGFVKTGALASLPESDSFMKWVFEHLEKGPETPKNRLKAYYAADFGTKADLKKGEHPKVIIVGRKLQADKNGWLQAAAEDVDVEVRTIWQPWLRSRCNFVARYIVPNRVNMVKILEQQGRFTNELVVNKDGGDSYVRMTFKPTLLERCMGRRNVVIKYPVDAAKLKKPPMSKEK
jgi:hypothetical protein